MKRMVFDMLERRYVKKFLYVIIALCIAVAGAITSINGYVQANTDNDEDYEKSTVQEASKGIVKNQNFNYGSYSIRNGLDSFEFGINAFDWNGRPCDVGSASASSYSFSNRVDYSNKDIYITIYIHENPDGNRGRLTVYVDDSYIFNVYEPLNDKSHFDCTVDSTYNKTTYKGLSKQKSEYVNKAIHDAIRKLMDVFAIYNCDLTEYYFPNMSKSNPRVVKLPYGDKSLRVLDNWKIDKTYNGFAEFNGNLYYFTNGVQGTDEAGIYKGTYKGEKGYYYVETYGTIRTGEEGFAYCKEEKSYYYYNKDGKVDLSINGMVKGKLNGTTEYWYVKNGKVQFVNGVVIDNNRKFPVINGKYDWCYNGFLNASDEWFLFSNGYESFESGLVSGTINNEKGQYYCINGKAQLNDTGIVYTHGTVRTINDDEGHDEVHYWYVEKGKYKAINAVVKGKVNGEEGWWYVGTGMVDLDYTGIGKNNNGWWYCINGKVDFKKNGVVYGKINGQYSWYYVKGGKVDFSYTGLSKYEDEWLYMKKGKKDSTYTGLCKYNGSWWYVRDGKVAFSYTGLSKYNGSWWYVKNGKVAFSYTGLSEYNGDWYYVKSGKVDFSYNGLCKSNGSWWYVKSGKGYFSYIGLVKYKGNWWYIDLGRVDESYTGLCKYNGSWWYIQNGKVNFNYTGFAQNYNGWWYCEKGKVNFGKNDIIKGTVVGVSGYWYVKGGQVKFVDSVEKNSSGWWCIRKGKVNFNFTGIASNASGSWYCKGGKVQFGFTGTIKYNNKTYKIKAGKVVK